MVFVLFRLYLRSTGTGRVWMDGDHENGPKRRQTLQVRQSFNNLNAFTYYLLIFVATSVDVEQVFSQGRIILSHLRSRLSVQSTRALMCIGVWSCLGYVNDSDIAAAVMQPEVPVNKKEGQLVPGNRDQTPFFSSLY